MYKKSALSSIPETDGEENESQKWVPKKKHEVLKAKYKCLKKLFQIYDASVIGVLPETSPAPLVQETASRRRKRSHRTKTDAGADTNELSCGDNNIYEYNYESSLSTNAYESNRSCISTQINTVDKTETATATSDNFDTCQLIDRCEKNCHCQNFDLNCNELCCDRFCAYAQPNIRYDRPRLTRFQCFMQRLFGLRYPEGQLCTSSDPILNSRGKRRRRGLRFRRIRSCTKRTKSESALRDVRNPGLLSYVQSVQKSCLMDRTPRKCPMPGCDMVSYGIINYNDHLNFCHFKDRKCICLYCHEGFENEQDKLTHENEHIGLDKLGVNLFGQNTSRVISNEGVNSADNGVNNANGRVNSNRDDVNSGNDGVNLTRDEVNLTNNGLNPSQTQTEKDKIREEKLKKIVSFFDKINNPDKILGEVKKNRYSDTNLTSQGDSCVSGSTTERSNCTNSSGKSSTKSHTSCCNLNRYEEGKVNKKSKLDELCSNSSVGLRRNASFNCRYCGESFTCRRQLSLHVNSEHRTRCPKYHSCAGIVRPQAIVAEDGSLNVHCADSVTNQSTSQSLLSYGKGPLLRVNTTSTITSPVSLNVTKSKESLHCDPSADIVYYSSMESVRKPSLVNSIVSKVRSYHWEPGTKIIRV